MMRTLYLESFAGIAGDMFTAAFLDAGLVDPEAIEAVPSLIGAPDVTVEITDTQRANARFKSVRVVGSGASSSVDHHHVGEDHTHHHFHYPALVRQLEESDLDPAAVEFALRVYRFLAEAEADSHGVPVEKVAFHEVGAVDSVVDVAMAGVCVATVAADLVLASPVKLGRGTIEIQHGTYPVPPPASARLAVGMPVDPVPEAISQLNIELSTPTGLAILKALQPRFVDAWPTGTVVAQGSGAGTRDLGGYPNVFRVALMEKPEAAIELPYESDTVVEIRCNLDDQTGERTAWIMEKALDQGALDAWVTQAVGKKGRPAFCLTLLVKPDELKQACDFLLRHTSTFGVRYAPWRRFKLTREEEVRETKAGPVSYKVGRTTHGEKIKEKPEFEDLKRIWEDDPDFLP
ncbi:MAG: LarC family nickel insertion protein [Gemmatimonadetes bacterium]|nr:LarC family nickel insertion protein [Gemmatimonadota bacterium]